MVEIDGKARLEQRLLYSEGSSRPQRNSSLVTIDSYFQNVFRPCARYRPLPIGTDSRLNVFSLTTKEDWDEENSDALQDSKGVHEQSLQWEEARKDAKTLFQRCAFYALSNYAPAYLTYLCVVVLLGALVLFLFGGCSLPDAIFMASSSTTQAGLSVINYAESSSITQYTSFALMILGSPLLLTVVPLLLRCFAFRFYRDWCNRHQKPLPCKEDHGALCLLVYIVLTYWLGVTMIGFGLCILVDWRAQESITHKSNMIWNALFMSSSAFQNNGLALTPQSLEQLADQPYALYVMMLLIILGNTGVPIFLRIMVRALFRCSHEGSPMHRYLTRLLAEPRHYYTHMFSSVNTLWLMIMLIALLAIQVFCIFWFDWDGSELSSFSPTQRLANINFQAASTRTAGLNSVELENLSMPTAYIIIVCMYISTSPLVVTMRTTNVKHQQTLRDQVMLYFTQHALILSGLILIVLIFEQPKTIKSGEPCTTSESCDLRANFSFFKLLFEVVSAYGTVGLSLGSTATGNSFCSDWTKPAQLLLCLVMFIGRTRDLPLHIDHPFHVEMDMESMREERNAIDNDMPPVRVQTWSP